ncbi:MAG TPA: hypothetical protein PL037_02295 [Elusimicrobiales bacterium]|nr:hypothetical protein [Elusimicrobiales bacterium]
MGTTKKELLKMINDAMLLEDRSIQIYQKHLSAAVFWSGLTQWGQEQLRIGLNVLAKESGRHMDRLTALRSRVEAGGKDVY